MQFVRICSQCLGTNHFPFWLFIATGTNKQELSQSLLTVVLKKMPKLPCSVTKWFVKFRPFKTMKIVHLQLHISLIELYRIWNLCRSDAMCFLCTYYLGLEIFSKLFEHQYRPNCQIWLLSFMNCISIIFENQTNNSSRLGQYEPSSPSTKVLQGLGIKLSLT